jgi:hypothetical protein
MCGVTIYSQGWLLAPVNVPEEAAESIIVHASRVVCCMLTKCQLPEATPNLVAALAHLHSDQLPWHGLLLRLAMLLLLHLSALLVFPDVQSRAKTHWGVRNVGTMWQNLLCDEAVGTLILTGELLQMLREI